MDSSVCRYVVMLSLTLNIFIFIAYAMNNEFKPKQVVRTINLHSRKNDIHRLKQFLKSSINDVKELKKPYTILDQTFSNIQAENSLSDTTLLEVEARKEDKTKLSRPKRKVEYNRKKEKCKLHELTIDIEELGWSNWVLAPMALPFNYCEGDCSFPLNYHQNATNHAIIQSLSNGIKKVPPVCCSPIELHPLNLLYIDSNNSTQMKSYKDMTVASCGCL